MFSHSVKFSQGLGQVAVVWQILPRRRKCSLRLENVPTTQKMFLQANKCSHGRVNSLENVPTLWQMFTWSGNVPMI